MKKLLSLLLVALLATLSLTLAEEAAPAPATAAEEAPAEAVEETAEETPAEETAAETETGWLDVDAEGQEEAMEIYMLQGTILEVQEDGLLIKDETQGEVLVLISDETVQETGYELGVGDYVYVDYNGQMTRSLPPQVTAGRIVSHKLEGDVVEVYAEENALLLYGSDGNEYRINLPEAWEDETFDAQRAIVYYDGAATLSLPPQVSAGLVLPEYAIEDIITELSETSMTLGMDEGAVLVEFDPALLPEGLEVGDAVRVNYESADAGTNAAPTQVTATAILKISA